MTQAIEHARVPTPSGLASLRDLAESDIDLVVEYWHGGIADLEFLGIDSSKLGTPEFTHERHLRMLRTGDPEQRRIAFAIALDGKTIGYTVLYQYTPERNHSHWHIIARDKRAGGISTALYPHRIEMYFDTTNMERLIHQTRTRNLGVNRMLDKFVPIAETAYVAQPDGLAAPGEFHMRYVRREDVPAIMARAAALGLPFG